ncbi:MAG: 5'-deoxynucleotidase, partial [Clostridia bacterium]|nr:5'-deoxynucleotidase [Clostridia bacterium]
MQNRFYAVISRMKNINRWGLMRNTRHENLSEHSLETAQIAHALAILANRRFGKAVDPSAAAVAAMYHDTTEILTGDMPTPVKYDNDEIRTAYRKIEESAKDRLIALLPEDFREDFAPVFEPDEEIRLLVKAADKLSALIKCIEELN